MMNHTTPQTQPSQPQLPSQLPTPGQITLDPTNPLIWILIITALLGNLDEPIQATANLLKQLNTLLNQLNTLLKNRRDRH